MKSNHTAAKGTTMKQRYEILDCNEMVIATADTIEDARYAKSTRNAKMIFDTKVTHGNPVVR